MNGNWHLFHFQTNKVSSTEYYLNIKHFFPFVDDLYSNSFEWKKSIKKYQLCKDTISITCNMQFFQIFVRLEFGIRFIYYSIWYCKILEIHLCLMLVNLFWIIDLSSERFFQIVIFSKFFLVKCMGDEKNVFSEQ